MPPAVEPGDVAGVVRVDLGTLERPSPDSGIAAQAEIRKAMAVIERELRYLDAWAHRQALRPLVSDLRQKVEEIRRAELARALPRAGRAATATTAVLDRLSRRLLDQVLAMPLAALQPGRPADVGRTRPRHRGRSPATREADA